VGTGTATTVLGLATMLHELIGGPEPVVTGQTREGDIRHCVADVSRIKAALRWTPRVPLADGLRALVATLRPEMVATRRDTAHAELAERGLVG
jgi:dTDP-L-rhamnose 4-epimerase